MMSAPVALLIVPGSSLGDALGPRIEVRGVACHVLDLDAPLVGKPVTIGPRRLTWEGFDLLSAGALLVEKPVFPWPQPTRIESLSDTRDRQASFVAAEREARSLIVSAIRVAAVRLPVVNPPGACHLAAAPATALDMAERAGIPVTMWRLEPMRHAETAVIVLDSVGRDRWHAPTGPAEGDPAIVISAPAGPITTVLITGRQAAVTIRHESAQAWATGNLCDGRPETARDPVVVEMALRAAEACDLSLAEITVGALPAPHIFFINPAPDLTAWGLRSGGQALEALADHLVRLAAQPAGTNR